MSITLASIADKLDILSIDVIENEILTKMGIHTLMALRMVNHKFREMVSKYLGIKTDTIEYLAVVFQDGKAYSISANKYSMIKYFSDFEKKFNWTRSNDINMGVVHKWSCYQTMVIVEQGGCVYSYIKNGYSWSNPQKPQLVFEDNSILSEWLYDTYVEDIRKDEQENEDIDNHVYIYFYKNGVEISFISFHGLFSDNEEVVKTKISKFLNKCEKQSKYCKISV
jgi:hypothetical protein